MNPAKKGAINNVILFFLILLALAPAVHADGGIRPNHYENVYAPEQKAAIFWNGSSERMILSTKIVSENMTNLAWIIPIQSTTPPEVKKADIQIFFVLADVFGIRPEAQNAGSFSGATSAASNNAGVTVIYVKKIDFYDLTVLKATGAAPLVEWLNTNNFSFPEDKLGVLDYYVKQGNYYFVANKIMMFKDSLKQNENLTECAGSIYYSPLSRYQTDSVANSIKNQFDDNEKCVGVNFDSVSALVQLREGIATPLEVSFTPEKPFYPMRISSINEGYMYADIYLFGKNCFDDASGILQFNSAVADANIAKEHGFNGPSCISRLTYGGYASDLTADSFFTEKKYEKEFNPYYDPARQDKWGINDILTLVVLVLIFASWALIPAIVLGVLFASRHKRIIVSLILVFIIILPALLLTLLLGYSFYLSVFGIIKTILALLSVPSISFIATYYFAKRKVNTAPRKMRKSKQKPSGLKSAVIIGVLLVASSFVGYAIKAYMASSEIQDLREQAAGLQNQNSQLQQQIDKLLTVPGYEATAGIDVPSSVLVQYIQLVPQYEKSFGTSIRYCTKNIEKIYEISGNGGFGGVTLYYAENGTGIGASYWTDAIGPEPPPPPPVNISEYSCVVIKKSESRNSMN